MSVATDAITVTLNPQLAARAHSPFAVEAEAHVLAVPASRTGYVDHAAAAFTTGGAEANLSALLCAIYASPPGAHIRGSHRSFSSDAKRLCPRLPAPLWQPHQNKVNQHHDARCKG
jgi:hypothetical protein